MSSGSESCMASLQATPVRKQELAWSLLKLAKPGIVLAEVLAGLAGMLLVTTAQAKLTIILPTLLAIALTASGAAMLNNILDSGADKLMPRLSSRCLALENVGADRVMAIALFLIGAGLALIVISSSLLAIFLLAGGCLCYVWLYTAWLKRCSPWGVLAGGIPGALPPLIGAAAISGRVTLPSLLIMLFVFIWQLPHFWLLALQCRDQYAKAGIPVLPVTHGESLTRVLTLATALLLLPVSLVLGQVAALSPCYLTVAFGAGVIFPLYCARCLYQTHAYRQGFIASLLYLLTIIAAICVEPVLAKSDFTHWKSWLTML